MKNIDLLLTTVEPVKHSCYNLEKIVIKNLNGILDGTGVYTILEHIKWYENGNFSFKTNIEIQCQSIRSVDVIVVLETIMLYLALHHPRLFKVTFTKLSSLAKQIGFYESLLYKYNGLYLSNHFITDFNKPIKTDLKHFRRICLFDKKEANPEYLSSITEEVLLFYKHAFIHEGLDENRVSIISESISEACSEIVDNVFNHSFTDCVEDLIVSRTKEGQIFISICIISLSDIFMGQKIIELFKAGEFMEYSGYDIVEKAYKNHKSHFDNSYDELAFGFVCSFQKGVSSRKNSKYSGGTGLTTTINTIHSTFSFYGEKHLSYILSGNNTIYFDEKYLTINGDGLIGFNDTNDFINDIPNKEILKKEKRSFPGTIFSVNLLI